MKNVKGSVACVGMDVHYEFSKVAFCDERGAVVRRERLEHRDREGLIRRVAQWPAGLPVVMEASFGWGWLSDVMEETGLKVRLSNCFKVEKMRKARGWVKTNDKDAALQAQLLLEKNAWWEVWRAPQEVRERREWMRHRTDLVMIQTQTKERIHAIFHRHGIFHDFSDLFGSQGRRFLTRLASGQDGQSRLLPSGATEALRGDLALLVHLRGALAKIARALRVNLERNELARCLDSVPGFGLILAHVLMAEVGELRRFASARKLASYSLLAPQSDDTGEDLAPGRKPLGRHLGVRGNRTLKWAFIEAAHGAVRSGGPWRELFDRQTDGGKQNRGHGYIGVARALVNVVYAVWRDRRCYQPQRPSRSSRPSARPGTGRLCRPMVAASK
jgi:transposase